MVAHDAIGFYKEQYRAAFDNLLRYYEGLDTKTFFENIPDRERINDLMDWTMQISPIYGSLGQIQAETEALLNRLKMIAIEDGDLPKDEKTRRAVIASSTMFTQYLDGKFAVVSRLRDQCKEDRRSFERILDMARTIISEYKTARIMGEVDNSRR